MGKPERDYKLAVAVVERLRREQGLSLESLAGKAGVHVRSLKKWMKGGRAFIRNINKLAKALNTTAKDITHVEDIAIPIAHPLSLNESHVYDLTINVKGRLTGEQDSVDVIRATQEMMHDLTERGIEITTHNSQLSISSSVDGDLKRIVIMIYGQLPNGNPFWLFAAVKPEMYALFKTTQQAGKVDIYNFEPFGEIIVSGEGAEAPNDVVDAVAEMYQIDPSTLRNNLSD